MRLKAARVKLIKKQANICECRLWELRAHDELLKTQRSASHSVPLA